MSRLYQRPENALKRAHEFIDVGKPTRALEGLYEVIKRGKMRANCSEKLLEPIMHKYLELCVDLKKSHLAKEGLYQYRNIFQSVNVSSLETVVRFYLQLADERTESARLESHQAVVEIDDLDNITSPEEMLLRAVSGEDAQDRSDRTILTPWVKFLWESYRQCLELLRTNSRVEKLYHDIAKHAFKFCEKYGRKTEFRKLCDNLRTHLSHIQKQQGLATAVNLNNPETQQLNLETRLEQLNYAIKMELWQEAYKAIEDISDLMGKSKKMPKPHVMAMYYQKLALVFWKAGNLLFHAAALFKLFQLLRDQKKNITYEELSKRASVVLLATLAIPLPSAHPEFDRFIETEKSASEKVDKLALLLSLPKPPTRSSLIKDIMRFNVVSTVPAELQHMYSLMEEEFDPLNLCPRMHGYFKWINDKPESGLPQYIDPLKQMIICRLVKQIAQIYQTITFERFIELAVFVSPFHLERVLVDLVRHNDLQIRIDHKSSCINFGMDFSESQREDLPEGPTLQTLPSETIRCQLVHMSSAVHKCLALIIPDNKKKEMEPIRAQTIQLYQHSRKNEHHRLLQRQHIIEERKEMLENQNLEREELHRRAQEEQLKRQKEEEQDRLRREATKREKERQEEQMKQIHTKQIKDKLLQISKTSYGQKMIEKIDKEELLNLGAEEILQRQVEELEKERKELQKKLKTQEKNIDYFERAKRLLEIPKQKKVLDKQKEEDKEFWKTQEEERVKDLIEDHIMSYEHCNRLKRMAPDRSSFMDKLKSSRRSEIEKKLNDFNARLEVERKNRVAERKEQRRRERREAYFLEKAEEEQLRRDEELKKQREDEERLEAERMQQEEEERANHKIEMEKQEQFQRGLISQNADDKSAPWRPKRVAASRQKEQEKMDVWRVKDEETEKPRESKFFSRDIRRDDPSKDEGRHDQDNKDWGRYKDGEQPKDEKSDWRAGPSSIQNGLSSRDRISDNAEPERGPSQDERNSLPKDYERPPNKEFVRRFVNMDNDSHKFGSGPTHSKDTERVPPTRDSEGGPPSRGDLMKRPLTKDIKRSPQVKDIDTVPSTANEIERVAPSKDTELAPTRLKDLKGGLPSRDFERGPGSRDFERGPGSRDFERGPGSRDFERGPGSRDFERGPGSRDFERGPGSRDLERGPYSRIPDRGTSREFEKGSDRFGGGDSWRENVSRFRDRDNMERGGRRGADFVRGDRRGTDFERGDRKGTDFERGDRKGTDFERGDRKGTDFERGDRKGTDFERGDRKGTDFERGDRRGTDFERGDRRGTDFERGDRRGTDFERGSNRRGTDFERGDNRRGTDFERGDKRGPQTTRTDEGSSWRKGDATGDEKTRNEDKREEADGEGWTTVRR